PCDPGALGSAYDVAVVVSARGAGPSFWRARLPAGPRVVIVLPDESQGATEGGCDLCAGMARSIQQVSLELPAERLYPYRLVTAVTLAELARRQGWRPQ